MLKWVAAGATITGYIALVINSDIRRQKLNRILLTSLSDRMQIPGLSHVAIMGTKEESDEAMNKLDAIMLRDWSKI